MSLEIKKHLGRRVKKIREFVYDNVEKRICNFRNNFDPKKRLGNWQDKFSQS